MSVCSSLSLSPFVMIILMFNVTLTLLITHKIISFLHLSKIFLYSYSLSSFFLFYVLYCRQIIASAHASSLMLKALGGISWSLSRYYSFLILSFSSFFYFPLSHPFLLPSAFHYPSLSYPFLLSFTSSLFFFPWLYLIFSVFFSSLLPSPFFSSLLSLFLLFSLQFRFRNSHQNNFLDW